MRKISLLLYFTLLSPLFAETREIRILDNSAHSLGMGGVGVSTFGYRFSPMANPATLGLMSEHTMLPIVEFGFILNNSFIGMVKDFNAINNGTPLDSINYEKHINQIGVLGLSGPLSIGFMSKGFGIWVNTGTEASVSIYEKSDSLARGIQFSTLADTSKKVSDIWESNNGSISAGEVENILNQGIYQDLINSGLSPIEAHNQVNKLVGSLVGADGNYINPDGSINEQELNNALINTTNSSGQITMNEQALKAILPQTRTSVYSDIAINIGYGYKIPFRSLDNVSGISFGTTVRFLQRFKSDTTSELDINNPSKLVGDIYQAFVISSDFGVSLRLQNFILAFAARDAFSSSFQWRTLSGNSAPATNTSFLPSLDIGASYRFYFKNPFIQEVGMYAEMVDMLSTSTSALHKIRLGLETKLFRFLDFRLGMYDLFISTGIGMGWKWFRMDFAYYRKTYTFSGYNIYSDQFNLNFAVGLENTPERKARAVDKKAALDAERAARQNILEENPSI